MAEQPRLAGKFAKRAGGEVKPDAIVNTGADKPVTGSPAITIGGTLSPETADRTANEQRKPGKRGRPPGSGNKEKDTAAPRPEKLVLTDLKDLNATLALGHATLAMVLKTPELALDDDEARLLADACQNVARHYNVQVSGKAKDWCMLLMTMASIYRPRIISARARVKAEKLKATAKPEASAPRPAAAPLYGI